MQGTQGLASESDAFWRPEERLAKLLVVVTPRQDASTRAARAVVHWRTVARHSANP